MFPCCQLSGHKYINHDNTIDRTVLDKIMPPKEVDELLKQKVGRFGLCKCHCHVKGSVVIH